MKQRDTLGRATFHDIAPKPNVRPTEREIRWLRHIDRHGPQNSGYLHALTSDSHRCKDTSLRQLQKLRAGGYLMLPGQQRATEHAEFNPFIYDLTKRAKDHLFDLGLNEATVRPTGHWWHGYLTSCVTASIDMAAAQSGVRYVPAHDILAIRNASLAIPLGRVKLIPDQLFALNYGGSFRVFALEVDRGTEPKTSLEARKSYARSIEQYCQVVERQIYRTHYGLKANMVVLWVFTSRSNEARFLDMVGKIGGSFAKAVLTQSLHDSGRNLMRASPRRDLFLADWNRAYGDAVSISRAE